MSIIPDPDLPATHLPVQNSREETDRAVVIHRLPPVTLISNSALPATPVNVGFMTLLLSLGLRLA